MRQEWGRWEKRQKTRASQTVSRRKTPRSEHGLLLYKHHGYPPTSDQGLTFQTHALQMILFGSSLRTNPVSSWGRHELSPYINYLKKSCKNIIW